MVFGERSNLPFYYLKLSGNISDSKTVKRLLADLNVLNLPKVKLVMDRGFYSTQNMNDLYKGHIKFLIATKTSLTFIRKELDSIYERFRSFEHFSEKYELYARTIQSTWRYTEERHVKGDVLHMDKRIYIHYYYNIDRAAEDEKAFDKKLIAFQREIESSRRVYEHEAFYQKVF
jgi:transposase